MTAGPVVCSLGGPELAGRFDEWRDLARRALVEREPHPAGAVVRYRRTAETARELDRLIALETDCCAFLTFHLESLGDELRLTVTGPDQAAPLIRECWGIR